MARPDPLKEAVKVLKQRVADGALEVASPQWVRAYWRSHPHKLVDFVQNQFPKVVEGSGDEGQHVINVIHAIKPSLLDGPQEVVGQLVSIDGVEVSRG